MYDLALNDELRSAQFRSYMYMYFQGDILSQWLKKVGNWVLVSLTPYDYHDGRLPWVFLPQLWCALAQKSSAAAGTKSKGLFKNGGK